MLNNLEGTHICQLITIIIPEYNDVKAILFHLVSEENNVMLLANCVQKNNRERKIVMHSKLHEGKDISCKLATCL